MAKPIQAWHFVRWDRTLGREHNGKQVKIRKGQTLSVKPPLIICEHGLHASRKLKRAADYFGMNLNNHPRNNGAVICRVELSGKKLFCEDKFCSEKRKVLWWKKVNSRLFCEIASGYYTTPQLIKKLNPKEAQ